MGMSTSKESVCQSNGDSGAASQASSVFPSFPSDWAWTVIFLKLSFLFSWSRPADCQIHGFIEENWKHDVLNFRGRAHARAWQGLGHPGALQGTDPHVLSPSSLNLIGRFLDKKNKMQICAWPTGSAGSGYRNGVGCPINVCRINKCLKRNRGKEGKKWCLPVARTMYSKGRLLPPWGIWYWFPFLCIFIAYGFQWTWSLGHKVNEMQTYYFVLSKL